MNRHEVTPKAPKDCSDVEIGDFVSFVLAGGEVVAQVLEVRVRRAERISFLRDNSCLLGVAGLKHPSHNHRSEVSHWSGVALPEETYPFELGWVFILPSARGRKLSLPLCAPLAEAAGLRGTFATSKTDNRGMHTTLQKLGFVQAGTPYKSPHGDHRLQLFLREPAQSGKGRHHSGPPHTT